MLLHAPTRKQTAVFGAVCPSMRALQPWLAKHRDELRLDFLPPYSPDLNPVERVWKLTRRLCTHNVYFESLDRLVDAVREQFAMWFQTNFQLCRLCAIT